jgi:hypothetical protein
MRALRVIIFANCQIIDFVLLVTCIQGSIDAF